MKRLYANLLLLLVAIIWGGGFIFVQVLLDVGMQAGFITMLRGGIFSLAAFIIFFKKIIKMTKKDVFVGVIAGGTNALGFLLQAIGQGMTTASHTALITGANVAFVPFVAFVFFKTRPSLKSIIAVIICVLGAFLLVNNFTATEGGVSVIGDLLVLVSAFMFGANIAYLGNRGGQTHYGVVAFFMGVSLFVISFIYSAFTKQMYIPTGNTGKIIFSLLYLGLFSSTLCQILQVVCQRHTSAVSASLILALESFFGGVFAIWYGDAVTWNLIVGGLLILLSVFVQEADFIFIKKIFKKKE